MPDGVVQRRCVGASGGGDPTAVLEFELARFHRYLDLDQRSSVYQQRVSEWEAASKIVQDKLVNAGACE